MAVQSITRARRPAKEYRRAQILARANAQYAERKALEEAMHAEYEARLDRLEQQIREIAAILAEVEAELS